MTSNTQVNNATTDVYAPTVLQNTNSTNQNKIFTSKDSNDRKGPYLRVPGIKWEEKKIINLGQLLCAWNNKCFGAKKNMEIIYQFFFFY